jgi:hypothetical protein
MTESRTERRFKGVRKRMLVSELIEELSKMPQDAIVGHYNSNAYNLGDPFWISRIEYVSLCNKPHPVYNREVVQLVWGIG